MSGKGSRKGLGHTYVIRGKRLKTGTELVVNKSADRKNARIATLVEQHKKHPGAICLEQNGKKRLVEKKHIRGIVRRDFGR